MEHEKKGHTLPEILRKLEEADLGLAEFNPEEMKGLIEELGFKTDSYKYVLEKYESEAERLSKRIKEFQEAKKTIENRQENLKRMMAHFMEANHFEQIPGNNFTAKLQHNESVGVAVEATDKTFMESPQFHRVKYEWDKTALKDHLRAGNTLVYAALQTKPSVRFYVRKD